MKILVTGGSGFIGTNLIELLHSKGYDILNFDIKIPQIRSHQRYWRAIDLRDFEAMFALASQFKPTHIVHLGARTDLLGSAADSASYDSNTVGVENIIKIIERVPGINRTIFASSRLVFDISTPPKHELDFSPRTQYGRSKVAGEMLVREKLLNKHIWTIVRPTSIWGPWFGEPYLNFFKLVHKGLFIYPGKKVIRKNYGFVGNAVDQLLTILLSEAEAVAQKTMFLTDEPFDLMSWVKLIENKSNAPKVPVLPVSCLKILARIGDALKYVGVKPPLTSFRLNNILSDVLYDTSLTEKICGNAKNSLEQGVEQTIQWMVNQKIIEVKSLNYPGMKDVNNEKYKLNPEGKKQIFASVDAHSKSE